MTQLRRARARSAAMVWLVSPDISLVGLGFSRVGGDGAVFVELPERSHSDDSKPPGNSATLRAKDCCAVGSGPRTVIDAKRGGG